MPPGRVAGALPTSTLNYTRMGATLNNALIESFVAKVNVSKVAKGLPEVNKNTPAVPIAGTEDPFLTINAKLFGYPLNPSEKEIDRIANPLDVELENRLPELKIDAPDFKAQMDALVARGATGVLLSFSTKGDIERLERTNYAGIFEIMMSFFNRSGKPAHIKFHIDGGQKYGKYIDGFLTGGGRSIVTSVVDVIGPEQYADSAGTSSGDDNAIGPSRYEYDYLGTRVDDKNFPTETNY
jgi:hypothetical protein